jgi:hypothetical protein
MAANEAAGVFVRRRRADSGASENDVCLSPLSLPHTSSNESLDRPISPLDPNDVDAAVSEPELAARKLPSDGVRQLRKSKGRRGSDPHGSSPLSGAGCVCTSVGGRGCPNSTNLLGAEENENG